MFMAGRMHMDKPTQRVYVHVYTHLYVLFMMHVYALVHVKMSMPMANGRRCPVQFKFGRARSDGGALYIGATKDITITDSTFADNVAVPVLSMHAYIQAYAGTHTLQSRVPPLAEV